jgi:hypothetical protein
LGQWPEDSASARQGRLKQGGREVLHAPTVVLVQIGAPWTDGLSYGAYWHDLLHHQSMLALGLYRPVRQQGVRFDCVMTHPSPVSVRNPPARECLSAGERLWSHLRLGLRSGRSCMVMSRFPSHHLGGW